MNIQSICRSISSLFCEHFLYSCYVIVVTLLFIASLSISMHRYVVYVFLIMAIVPIFTDAIKDLIHKRIGTDLFLLFATAIGLWAQQERAVSAILIIMIIAKFTEQLIRSRTNSAIQSLIKLVPTDVTIRINGQEKFVGIDHVKEGMLIVIKTGQRIPVDGVIVEGNAEINESFLTGESIPKEKNISDLVFAGSFIEAGGIVVRVKKVGKGTVFSKISDLVEQAEKNKAHVAVLSNKIASFLVPLTMLFILVSWFITHDFALIVTLLVFGAPVELTLVTPLAILAGMVAAFRHGILIKGSIALERFAKTSTIIFDKTGTLTMGEPKVVEIVSTIVDCTPRDVLAMAAMAEQRSGHILSKAILQKASEENIIPQSPEMYESITGHGVVVTYKGQRYALGSKHFIQAPEHENIEIPNNVLCSTPMLHSSFYLCRGNTLIGRICVTDVVRHDAHNTIVRLKQLGIKNTILLSGDKNEVAQNIGANLGVDKAYGEAEPTQKLAIIKDLQNKGEYVAMVGDGINDAPALKQADTGIAMGAMGTEPAIEAADIVLMQNNLDDIVFVVQLSHKVFRLIKQNIVFGFMLIHLLGTVLAFMHLIAPIQAAIVHAFSDLFILLNSVRIIRFKAKK